MRFCTRMWHGSCAHGTAGEERGERPLRQAKAIMSFRRAAGLPVAAFVLAVGTPTAHGDLGWATRQAAEMTRQGRDHLSHGDVFIGAQRVREALEFDPTYAPAYLALAQSCETNGDLREAELVYSVGIEHVARWAEGLRARARLRTRLGRSVEALADLEAAAAIEPNDVPLLVELEEAYVARRLLAAALAAARRCEAVLCRSGDASAASEARVRVRALAFLVGDLDPVNAGARNRGLARSALARYPRCR